MKLAGKRGCANRVDQKELRWLRPIYRTYDRTFEKDMTRKVLVAKVSGWWERRRPRFG